MNKLIEAVTSFNFGAVEQLLENDSKWRTWSQPDGKNALHFLCGTPVVAKWNVPGYELKSPDAERSAASLALAKLLIKNGLDINSIHKIPDKNCGHFPATPVWYAYTRGRNEKLYKWLLKNGGSPHHCMFAITWYDDAKAAELFKKYGALSKNEESTEDKHKLLSNCLIAALGWKKYKIAEWLLQNGADPNSRDPRGNTVLTYCVEKKYPADIIKMLVQHGADADLPNAKGKSARQIARSFRDKTIFDVLT